MFNIQETEIQGCLILQLNKITDHRGYFLKSFNHDFFAKHGLEFTVKEEYFSNSKQNVIRGMHFQTPPYEHDKIVRCLEGSVVDVVLDIRKESKTYGKFVRLNLSGAKDEMIFIPKGCAHGFLSLQDNSLMQYMVSSGYSKDNDTGILYDSFGLDWNCKAPIISDRDLSFSAFNNFNSPF